LIKFYLIIISVRSLEQLATGLLALDRGGWVESQRISLHQILSARENV